MWDAMCRSDISTAAPAGAVLRILRQAINLACWSTAYFASPNGFKMGHSLEAPMRSSYCRGVAIGLIAMVYGTSTAASAERWLCEMQMTTGKTYKQEWIVSEDKMFAPKGKGYFRVVLNNRDILLAFFRFWNKDRTANNSYVIIAKSTGVVTEIEEAGGLDFGPQPEEWVSPTTTIGHCSLE